MNRPPGATVEARWACDCCGNVVHPSVSRRAGCDAAGPSPAIGAGPCRDSVLPRLCERCLSDPGAIDDAAANIRARGWEDGRTVERDAIRFARRAFVTLPVVVVR